MSKRMKVRQWENEKYSDPSLILLGLREIQNEHDFTDIPEKVASLRIDSLKCHKEGREAALFCHGIGSAFLDTKVYFTMLEEEDYDFVALFEKDNEQHFVPVQLKELVPENLGNSKSLYEELEKLQKYSTSEDLTVAFYLNREASIDFGEIDIPDLNLAGLYFFGSASQDQSKWFIFGGKIGDFVMEHFDYPKT
jgi:hypothetical protein